MAPTDPRDVPAAEGAVTVPSGPSRGPELLVDVWADLVCPFCLLGDEQLRRAIAAEGLEDRVRIRRHSFELDPQAPEEPRSSLAYLAERMGVSREEAACREAGVRDAARALGLGFALERPMASTLTVHRAVQHAERSGRGHELFRTLQQAYFAGELDPFDTEALVAAAVGIGLDAQALRADLADPASEEAVRADEAAAERLGARGAPFTVVAGRLGVPGAVGEDVFREALREGLALT